MLRKLSEFKGPEAIFIDANIFLHHAFDANPVSIQFLKKVEGSNIKAYTSALVLEEVTFKLVMQSASNYLKRLTLRNVKSFLKDPRNKEKVFKPVIEYREYINTLRDFGLTILDLMDKDIQLALGKAKAYGLIIADAAHIAVMERKEIHHLASSDHDFNLVDGISLWLPE